VKVGAALPRQGGGWVLATAEGLQFWDETHLMPIVDPEAGKVGARFNDAKVDPQGRLWAGTLTQQGATSSLYRLDADLSLHTMVTGVTISNGLGWSPDGRTLYHADTRTRTIFAYDFDGATGAISRRRPWVTLSKRDGLPDGLTVDAAGEVWVALWGAGAVAHFDAQGRERERVRVAASQTSSCTFGGPERELLFITSAAAGVRDEPQAGSVFVCTPGAQGQVEAAFAG
jgi:sugar lactone lactonase YvrE